MKNVRKHKARDKGRRTHAMALGACGERAVAPACGEGKLKHCSSTRAAVYMDDSYDVQHDTLEGLSMQQLF